MTPHERALELLMLARRDQDAAHVLQADSAIDDAIVGFHHQQAAEKLLKALLADQNIDFPRTHDLTVLAELVEGAGYTVPVATDDLESLTPFAVTLRYRGDESDTQLDRAGAEALVRKLCEWVEGELQLYSHKDARRAPSISPYLSSTPEAADRELP